MRGKPKYQLGQKVVITIIQDGKKCEYEGEVAIIDKYGTWTDPTDVSYDVMVQHMTSPQHPELIPYPCLVKHCSEKLVKPAPVK